METYADEHGQALPSVTLAQCAAMVIDQVLHGFEKEPLLNDDLVVN